MISPVNVREKLLRLAREKIIILDGAMGSLIQACRTPSGEPLGEDDFRGERFRDHSLPLKGCNDILCLTRPELISEIHEAYLKAGADIVETCSFNATSVSLGDYGIGGLAYELSAAAARLARTAADAFSTPEKPRFVAGSMGPTSKSAGLSHDAMNPGKRAIGWDELEAAYYDSARGLLDGGADILLIETVFDTLNAKAAIFAVRRLEEERGIDAPLIVSATVSNAGGRLLSGQSLEAFCVSVLHANPLALGLNCSFGAEKLKPCIAALSAAVPCLVSAYPNAGLPNSQGGYDESPETMANHIEGYFRDGLVNIAGGCCGSTPAHIAAIAAKAGNFVPRVPPSLPRKTAFAGLETREIGRERGLAIAGERSNAAGSAEFRELIAEENYEDAADLVRDMVEAGASLVDICMDGALPDADAAMTAFLNMALAYPDIARLPIMIDSSRWETIEAGLKCLPGKGIANSISLEDGEAEFIRKARLVRAYGAAAVAALRDEEGQALSYERKTAVAARAWKLLADAGFPPEDIVFDPLVLAATGIPEQDSGAPDFIRACAWIRDNCPGAQIAGGVSNLSFGFRGDRAIREAVNSVFLARAAEQGLSIAIANPAALAAYDDIDPELRLAAEDLVARGSTEKLLAFAETRPAAGENPGAAAMPRNGDSAWRGLPAEERIFQALLRGDENFLAEDIGKLLERLKPLEIVEGPLAKSAKEAGERFASGRMFLPQLVRAAGAAKKAVEILTPFLEKEAARAGGNPAKAKGLLATVRGDVHDIGKNIAALILRCGGCEIVDLGTMVRAEQILERAKAEKADFIGLSGLINPSLDEMIRVAREMEKQGFDIPLIVGGAAASLAHTARRIAPEYSGPVVYVSDAGRAPAIVRALLSETERPGFLEELKESYAWAMERGNAIHENRILLPLEEARKNKSELSWRFFQEGAGGKGAFNLEEILGYPPNSECSGDVIVFNDYPIDRVIPYIDWTSFAQTWDLAAKTYPSAFNKTSPAKAKRALEKLLGDAKGLLEKLVAGGKLRLRGTAGFFPAYSEGDDIVIPGAVRFAFPRNQQKKPEGSPNPCLADFILPGELFEKEGASAASNPWARLGLFALGAGFGLEEIREEFKSRNGDYDDFLLLGLANSLAEAFSEELHRRLRRSWGGGGIRPVFGYPACPDHRDKEIAFSLLDAKKRCGFELTETAMIIPAASVCGMYMAHPNSYYFGAGIIGDDQLRDWAARKGVSVEEAARRLGGN